MEVSVSSLSFSRRESSSKLNNQTALSKSIDASWDGGKLHAILNIMVLEKKTIIFAPIHMSNNLRNHSICLEQTTIFAIIYSVFTLP